MALVWCWSPGQDATRNIHPKLSEPLPTKASQAAHGKFFPQKIRNIDHDLWSIQPDHSKNNGKFFPSKNKNIDHDLWSSVQPDHSLKHLSSVRVCSLHQAELAKAWRGLIPRLLLASLYPGLTELGLVSLSLELLALYISSGFFLISLVL